MLLAFQRCGHKPVAVVGGATGMIGGSFSKSSERNLLDEATLIHNQKQLQLGQFLEFDKQIQMRLMVNNYDWMKSFPFEFY